MNGSGMGIVLVPLTSVSVSPVISVRSPLNVRDYDSEAKAEHEALKIESMIITAGKKFLRVMEIIPPFLIIFAGYILASS
ncbi:MAG: hypothetical protein IJQ56_11900 [Synergistaceae bacterium]|nr:hypothetical protein [Synergistaceae bacterium]